MDIQLIPAEYGIEESKAADIAAQFKPMLDKMVELETEYNTVISLPIDEAARPARDLRLKYVKVRTGTEKIHKEQKAFYLAAGRYVDGWKNAQLFAAQGIEKKLEDIEKYAENKEKERIASLQLERSAILAKYEVDTTMLQLGAMTEEVFANFVLGTKTAYENKKEAERIAEEQRLAAIEAERIRQEEIKLENERLKKEAAEAAQAAAIEAERVAKERAALEAKIEVERQEAARVAKIEADRQAAILAQERAKAKEEADKQFAVLAAERKVAAEQLLKEQEAAACIAAELQAKKGAEEKERQRLAKIEADRIAAEKKAAKAPDKVRLKVWVDSFLISGVGAENMSKESIDLANDIFSKFSSFKKWALTQIENL